MVLGYKEDKDHESMIDNLFFVMHILPLIHHNLSLTMNHLDGASVLAVLTRYHKEKCNCQSQVKTFNAFFKWKEQEEYVQQYLNI